MIMDNLLRHAQTPTYVHQKDQLNWIWKMVKTVLLVVDNNDHIFCNSTTCVLRVEQAKTKTKSYKCFITEKMKCACTTWWWLWWWRWWLLCCKSSVWWALLHDDDRTQCSHNTLLPIFFSTLFRPFVVNRGIVKVNWYWLQEMMANYGIHLLFSHWLLIIVMAAVLTKTSANMSANKYYRAPRKKAS